MIYVDSSVALAHLLTEARRPAESFWEEPLTASRLLEYEVWNRLLVSGVDPTRRAQARGLIGRISLVELAPPILARALEPYPVPVRTLDGLHLATITFLVAGGQSVELASYDDRLLRAADALGIQVHRG